jgi:hypothetical protein
MDSGAASLLPYIRKLERLLGHNLNITEEILRARVSEAIERQTLGLCLETAPVDPAKTNWNRIMADAAFRRPPFEAGKTEKGFRDALVLEAFDQIRASAPVDPKSCRVVLVSGDALLLEAARARLQASSNARLVSGIDELRGLINTLVSTVDEEFVSTLTPQATKIFFKRDDRATLYYSYDIPSRVRERFLSDIGNFPNAADSVELGGARIHPPQFVKKVSQRVFWSSRVEFELDAKKKVAPPTIADAFAGYGSDLTKGSSLFSFSENAPSVDWSKVRILGKHLGAPTQSAFDFSSVLGQSQTVATGRVAYDVEWSTIVSTAKRLSRQQVESFGLGEVSWE